VAHHHEEAGGATGALGVIVGVLIALMVAAVVLFVIFGTNMFGAGERDIEILPVVPGEGGTGGGTGGTDGDGGTGGTGGTSGGSSYHHGHGSTSPLVFVHGVADPLA
jgi:hypothetical protein